MSNKKTLDSSPRGQRSPLPAFWEAMERQSGNPASSQIWRQSGGRNLTTLHNFKCSGNQAYFQSIPYATRYLAFNTFITRGGFFNFLDNSPIFAGRGDCDSLSTNSTSLLMFATSDKSLTMLSRLDHVFPRLILFGGVAASCNCDEDACTELATS